MKKSQLIKLVNELVKENSIERELDSAFKQGAQVIATGAKNVKPSKHDKPQNEAAISGALALSVIVGGPGIMEIIGKTVKFIRNILNKFGLMNKQNSSRLGEWLVRNGHKWEDMYTSGLGKAIKFAFPKKFKDQDPNDKTSSLHDYSHSIYVVILGALAIIAGIQAVKAVKLSMAATKGSLAGAKVQDIVRLAKEIAKYGLDL